ERAFATLDDGSRLELAVCALGGSVATPAAGLTAPVVELAGMDALRAAGESVRGKIVFLSEPMAPTRRATFEAYGGAVGQRSRGAIEAARLGAVGVVIRSMSTAQDDAPHTGAMRYEDGVERIPAGALGVTSALRLARALRRGEVRSLTLAMHCRTLPEVEQWTVVGELPGTDLADQVVVVGGHLDAWDKGVGAHDDGSGCAQSIEAARLLKKVGHRPRRTLRVVLFANEENGLRGGRAYAEETRDEPHYLAMESDSGGFSPRGIALALPEASLARLRPLGAPLAVVGAERVLPGGEGADIGPLAARGALLASLRPDDARYFDVHHSDNDVLAAVNPRELELGAVVMAYWLAVLDGIEDLP
ncbi:MAG TPA: M20/M25/M40 family metallo-hydrolase, partial [Planctomycetota bacterium]